MRRSLSLLICAALAAVAAATPAAAIRFHQRSRPVRSVLETLDVATGQRHVVFRSSRRLEGPNWSHDGRSIVFNCDGRIYRLALSGGEPVEVHTGALKALNDDHGLSPDGRWLAVTDQPAAGAKIYVVPAHGGAARLVTPTAPSWFHGWSPDGKTLVFVGERGDELGIYTIPAAGGDETQVSGERQREDGPDFAPDGRIWFNAARASGRMHIWRMDGDGSNPHQMTRGALFSDWFPHPSPNGRWVAFLSYEGRVEGHAPDKHIALRLMAASGKGAPRVLARLLGGQGTMGPGSWSPDSRRIVFVSYRPLPPGSKPDE